MSQTQNLERITVGLSLLLARRFVSGKDTKVVLNLRRQFHPLFVSACEQLVRAIEEGAFNSKLKVSVPYLRQVPYQSVYQSERALWLAVQAFRSLGRLTLTEVGNWFLYRVLYLSRILTGEEQNFFQEKWSYEFSEEDYKELFQRVTQLQETPIPVRLLLNRIRFGETLNQVPLTASPV